MPEMDTREAVAAAFKEVQSREAASAPESAPEPAESAAPAPATESAPAKESAQEGAPQRDDKGRFVPAKPAAPEKPPAAPKGATGAAGQSGAAAPPMAAAPLAVPASAPAQEALKPPQNLRALAREKWSAWPREAQEEFVRLHHETSRTLAESTATRKAWEAHQQVISPYEGMIRTAGLEPAQAIGQLLQREQTLLTAPMQMRAQIIAHGIRTYLGTDEAAIGLLAQALDASSQQQGGPRQPQQFDPNQLIAQAEQRLMQRLEAARTESTAQAVSGELDAFSQSHEFMNEIDPETGMTIAEDMANIMEADVAKHPDGQVPMSYEDAYKKALKRHSVVNGIVQQREAARAATAKAATAQQARAASSTLKSEPAGPANGKPKDTREQVAQAYYAQKNAH